MANYRDIKGFQVQSLDSDPVVNAGTWASSPAINTGRAYMGSAGSYTAQLIFGGASAPSNYTDLCESWNGTAWTEVNELNTARQSLGGMGTSTAGLAASGRISVPADTDASEEWNGTSWSEGNEMNTERYAVNNRGAGTQTAGLMSCGKNRGPNSLITDTEEYDGTSWTEVTNAPAGLESGGSVGTQTAMLMIGGYDGEYQPNTFSYDGTNWTAGPSFPSAIGEESTAGSTTDGLVYGYTNDSAAVANTASYNGTVFTEVNDLSTARSSGSSGKAGGSTFK